MHIRVIQNPNRETLLRELREIDVSPRGIDIMLPKARQRVIRVYGLRCVAANLLKQAMLSVGGEAAVSYQSCVMSAETSDALIMGSERQIRAACERLTEQAFGLAPLAEEIRYALGRIDTFPAPLRSKNRDFIWGSRTYIMGIVNVTPDSFSGDGLAAADEPAKAAVRQALKFIEDGADIIDVGGESTRPGHETVDEDEEIRRVVPVIAAIRRATDVPISADTSKSKVARAALQAGADWLNDVWGLQSDPDMARVAAEFEAPVVVMHNQDGTAYHSLMGDIIAFLRESVRIAKSTGVPPERVVLDPGIGFGKTYEQNLEVLASLADLRAMGHPVLIGTSRKSVIGRTLDRPAGERLEGTAATVALSIAGGVDLIRVHDVREMALVAKMADAVVRRHANGIQKEETM